jgi:arylsulfatase A-like enzyme
VRLLAPALLFLAATLPACGARRPPGNVVLVTIDTLRADRLSLYGYHRPTSPEIDGLAARGVTFEQAWAQAPNTNPSIASALTSRRAPVTTVRGNAEKLDPSVPTLARVASDAGWETAAFVSTVLLRRDACALDPGFDVYDDEMTDPCWGHDKAQRIAKTTIDRALEWLAAREGREQPFFLWVHLYDPHGPYTPPEPTPELDATAPVLPAGADATTWLGADRIPSYLRVEGLTEPIQYADAYDREIRYADRHLGRLFAALDLSTTHVAVHADHGEDRYWFRHGTLLHDPALRIPMVIVGPGVEGPRRSPAVVGNIDLAPTLAALAGMPAIPGAEGRDMSRFLVSGGELEPEAQMDVTWWPAADERRVRAGEPRDVVTAMERMRAWLRGPDDTGPDAVSGEMEDALRGLGYVAPSETVTPSSSPASPERPR